MVTVGSILGGTFRYARSNIPAILIWSAILFVLNLVMMIVMRPVYANQMGALNGSAAALPSSGAPMLLTSLISLLVYVMLLSAAYRGVLFPERRGIGYLRLGMDELRLLICVVILVVGFYVAMAIVGTVVGLLLAIVGAASGFSAVRAVLIGVAVAAVGLGAWLGTRFSLAGPLTILDRKIVLGPSWRLTRGHFWRLLGAYAVIGLIVGLAYAVIMFSRAGPSLSAMLTPNDLAAQQAFLSKMATQYTLTPKSILLTVFVSLIGGVALALYGGVAAVATEQLLDRGSETHLEEVFE